MRKQLTAASIMVGLSTGLSILACGGGIGNNVGGEPCTFDSECPSGYVCDGEGSASCVPTCFSDDDCFASESCTERPSDPTVKLCTEGGTDNNPVGCTTVDDCPNTDDYVCTDGQCISTIGGNTCETVDDCPNTEDYACEDGACKSIVVDNNEVNPLFIVQIEDTSSGDASCKSTTRGNGDPGSDITYIELLDSDGTNLGYANQVYTETTDNDIVNDFTAFGHIDGSAPGLDTQNCPEEGVTGESFDFDTVLSLGCNGYILVEFIDPQGELIPLEPGYQIAVGEYGSQCGGSSADNYQVWLCSDTAQARDQDASSCDIAVGGVNTGNVSVDITTIE